MSGRVCKRKQPPALDPLLVLAGKMAEAARNVVGGQGVNFWTAPADVCTLSTLCTALREAVNAYDAAVIARTREGRKR